MIKSIKAHFPKGKPARLPKATDRPIASSNTLVKDTGTISKWLESARAIGAIEMELAGVYRAAQRIEKQYPILAIRGISDVVGFKRDDAWTRFACHSAASFAYALIRSGELRAMLQPRPAWSLLLDEFKTFVESRTENFTGRAYVFAAIEDFLSKKDRGYFIIQGDPGEGKSSILAAYVQKTGCLAYFNIRTEGRVSPDQFLDGMVAQFNARFGLALRRDSKKDQGSELRQFIEEAAKAHRAGERLVIAVDALDEVDQGNRRDGANVLNLPSDLPKGVYLIVTRRRLSSGDLPLLITGPQETFDLLDHKEECARDIAAHIQSQLERPKLRAFLQARGIADGDFVKELTLKSERNFMYLKHVIPEIETGAYHELATAQLPSGLMEFYEDHWTRMRVSDARTFRLRIALIYVLSEVQQAVSLALITGFVRPLYHKADAIGVQGTLDYWRQFLREHTVEAEKRYSLYHSSFREFLHRKDIVRASGMKIDRVHKAIADDLVSGVGEK